MSHIIDMKEAAFLTVFVYILQCCCVRAIKTYCDTDGPSHVGVNEGLRFKSKSGFPVVACTLKPITMYCCMTNFDRIQWFKLKNNVWLHLQESDAYNRYFYERNQTVWFAKPAHDDAGQYKCVGYRRNASDRIRYVDTLMVIDCLETDKPQPLYPLENRTELAIRPGSSLEFPCIGLVGPPQSSSAGEQRAIGWRRTIDRRTVPISDNVTQRVHFVNEWTIDDNALRSTLRINSVAPSDFDGEYTCWMKNKHATLNPARILIIQRRHVDSVTPSSPTFKTLAAACGCVLLLTVVVFVVLWRRRLHIKLYFKERRRTPPRDEDLSYDLVLMRSDDSEQFAAYLYEWLTTNNPYNKLEVFRYDDDVSFGHHEADCLMTAVSKSRCVLAVISPGFVDDQCCRFCFENTVRDAEVDVIYVLYGGITSPDDGRLDQALKEEVCVALRRSRRRFVSPLSPADLVEGDAEALRSKAVDQFLVGVRLAIPNRREGCGAEKGIRTPLLA